MCEAPGRQFVNKNEALQSTSATWLTPPRESRDEKGERRRLLENPATRTDHGELSSRIARRERRTATPQSRISPENGSRRAFLENHSPRGRTATPLEDGAKKSRDHDASSGDTLRDSRHPDLLDAA